MKPIHFSSFGGYRRFCSSWWNDLLWYTIGIDFSGWLHYREIDTARVTWGLPGWCHDVYTYWHRARYGWAPRDVWSLDHYLNRVLGSTLAHLADTTHGTPGGYPLGSKAPTDEYGNPATDHDQWNADLRKWSDAFLDLHAWDETGERAEFDKGTNVRDVCKMEENKYKKVEKALKELGPWWGGLWD